MSFLNKAAFFAGALAVSSSLSIAAQGAIKVEPKTKSDPARLTIRGTCRGDDDIWAYRKPIKNYEDCSYKDAALVVFAPDAYGTGAAYSLKNAIGGNLNQVKVSGQEAQELIAALVTATAGTPVVVEVDRKTLEIIRVIPSVDHIR